VRERGRLMEAAGQQNPGAMAALLGPDTTAVRDLCARIAAETGRTLVLANDNCPGQAVISGDVEAVDAAVAEAKTIGARRALKLAVSIASHSPLMASAQDGFRAALARTPISAPTVPVIGNVTAAPLADAQAIREELANQLTQSVRWTESVGAMIASGVTRIIEIGSKDVLTGLVKRIDAHVPAVALNSADALAAFEG
jgi:[acyl-carrier-protein] S-malonyltransferase